MGTSTVLKPLRSMRWFNSTSMSKHFDFTFQFLRMSAQITLKPVRGGRLKLNLKLIVDSYFVVIN